MNTFNKKSLYAAIAGVSALGMAGTANAVHVNPEGLGQVLIYPYYTVRARVAPANPIAGVPTFAGAQFNSLLSVVNSTASAKAVKVRFLEGKDSREVLDFNLYLSAHDVWTAGIIPTADGAGLVSFDKSCTTPVVSSNPASPTPFVNFAYTGTAADGATTSLDRTREGYVEIIEMGDVTGATAVGVTHVAGVPPCVGLADAIASTNTVQGSGGLFGGMTIINVNASAETGFDAVALDAFRLTGPIWNTPNSILPTLQQAAPPQAEIFQGATVVLATFASGIDAVSAAMMHDNVMNEYVLDTGTASLTDWVLTYPTKRYYVVKGTGTPPVLFQQNFNGNSGSCDDVTIAFWDREEQTPAGPPGGFSPQPPGSPNPALCWEANIVTWNNSNLFSSTNSVNIATPYQNGWGRLGLIGGATAPTHQLYATSGQTFNGLPVVGFGTNTFYNGAIPLASGGTIQSAYGASFKHRTTTLIQ